MGKIRVKTFGLEDDQKEQDKKARQNEAKKIEAAKRKAAKEAAESEKTSEKGAKNDKLQAETSESDTKEIDSEAKKGKTESSEKSSEPKKAKKDKFNKKKIRSAAYKKQASALDKNKKYTIKEALELLNKLKRAKFDETVELHINTNEKGVSGSLTLPHGTGKTMKVAIADNTSEPKKLEELIKEIESGNINFDILIATPDSMSHLAKVARYLGPKGLMPNPKNGTVSPKPLEAAKKFEGGQINFKTEAKAAIIHMTVGKLSFDEKKLSENIEALLKAIQNKNIKNATLKSTMSPGIKIII